MTLEQIHEHRQEFVKEVKKEVADSLATKDPDELIEDTRNFVRKSPGLAIGIAAVAGFLLTAIPNWTVGCAGGSYTPIACVRTSRPRMRRSAGISSNSRSPSAFPPWCLGRTNGGNTRPRPDP